MLDRRIIGCPAYTTLGSTKIYAEGFPMDGSSNVKAAYGASIGYKFWSAVTGQEESSLIKEAYVYLKGLEQQGKLSELP